MYIYELLYLNKDDIKTLSVVKADAEIAIALERIRKKYSNDTDVLTVVNFLALHIRNDAARKNYRKNYKVIDKDVRKIIGKNERIKDDYKTFTELKILSVEKPDVVVEIDETTKLLSGNNAQTKRFIFIADKGFLNEIKFSTLFLALVKKNSNKDCNFIFIDEEINEVELLVRSCDKDPIVSFIKLAPNNEVFFYENGRHFDKQNDYVYHKNINEVVNQLKNKYQYLWLHDMPQFEKRILSLIQAAIDKKATQIAVNRVSEHSYSFSTRSTSNDSFYTSQSEELNNSENEIADLIQKLGKIDTQSHWMMHVLKVVWAFTAAAGAYPNVIFTSDMAEEIFNDNGFMILWAKAASGVVNFAIVFDSLLLVPDLTKKIFEVADKTKDALLYEYKIEVAPWKVIAATIGLLMVNIGSFFSSKQVANDTAAKIPGAAAIIIYIAQLIAAVVTGLRATTSSTINYALSERDQVSEIVKRKILTQLNKLTSEPVNQGDLELLIKGHSYKGDKKHWPGNIALSIAALAIPVYCVPVGYSAMLALGGVNAWSVFSAAATYLARAGLLGLGAYKVRNNINDLVARIYGQEILKNVETRPSLTQDIMLGGISITLCSWLSFLGAGGVTQKYLMDGIFKMPHNAISIIFSNLIGGLSALPINIYSSIAVARKPFAFFKERNNYGKNFDAFIKILMVRFAEMSQDDLLNLLTSNLDIQERLEAGNLHALDRVLYTKNRVITSEKFHELEEILNGLIKEKPEILQAIFNKHILKNEQTVRHDATNNIDVELTTDDAPDTGAEFDVGDEADVSSKYAGKKHKRNINSLPLGL